MVGEHVLEMAAAREAVAAGFLEQVMRFAALTKMRMDKPEKVSRLIVDAVRWRKKEVVIGFPESVFVKVNAIAPSVVDQALFKGDRAAAALFAA